MSGPEWVIVCGIAVVLILLFVTLEWLFPIGDSGPHDASDRAGDGQKAAGSPVVH
jgi:hypothetical protein